MRILHVFRTPVGGLFRHVRDLARGQSQRGHDVGILCDSETGGGTAADLLAATEPFCELGVTRIPISRLPGWGDIGGIRRTLAHAKAVTPDIIHCHGAKGGLHGRIAGRLAGFPTVYTPHGGSLHYDWRSPAGFVFLAAEWLLARLGTGIHFVCDFEKSAFDVKIGLGPKPFAVVHNGLWPEEFTPRRLDADAADILFVGDMRVLKGVDVLLRALERLGSGVTACLVGDGPDLDTFRAMAKTRNLAVSFPGRMPAAEAFRRGRILVMPSRAESFPYVVLEALAQSVPLIASRVGGIPEILDQSQMVPPDDVAALAEAIGRALAGSGLEVEAAARAERLRQGFSAERMIDGVMALYGRILAGASIRHG